MNNHSPDYAWNLLPWRVQRRQAQREHLVRFLCKTLIMSLAMVAMIHVFLFFLLYKQNERNNGLLIARQKLQPEAIMIAQLKQQTIALQSQIKYLQHVIARHQHPNVKVVP